MRHLSRPRQSPPVQISRGECLGQARGRRGRVPAGEGGTLPRLTRRGPNPTLGLEKGQDTVRCSRAEGDGTPRARGRSIDSEKPRTRVELDGAGRCGDRRPTRKGRRSTLRPTKPLLTFARGGREKTPVATATIAASTDFEGRAPRTSEAASRPAKAGPSPDGPGGPNPRTGDSRSAGRRGSGASAQESRSIDRFASPHSRRQGGRYRAVRGSPFDADGAEVDPPPDERRLEICVGGRNITPVATATVTPDFTSVGESDKKSSARSFEFWSSLPRHAPPGGTSSPRGRTLPPVS